MDDRLGWYEEWALRLFGETLPEWQTIPMFLLFGSSLLALFVFLLTLLKKQLSDYLVKHFLNPYYEVIGLLGLAYLFSGTHWLPFLRFYQFTEENPQFHWPEIPYLLITGFVVLGTQLFWFRKNRQRTWLIVSVAFILCLPIYYVVYIQAPLLQSPLMAGEWYRSVRKYHLYSPIAFAALVWLYSLMKLLIKNLALRVRT